jgi:hypothetical protein
MQEAPRKLSKIQEILKFTCRELWPIFVMSVKASGFRQGEGSDTAGAGRTLAGSDIQAIMSRSTSAPPQKHEI